MRRLGIFAYGLGFTVVLPLMFVLWIHRLDRLFPFPAVGRPPIGFALAAAGAVIIAGSIVTLRRQGRGWPMSPFPPERRVATGMYQLMSDPIYAGSVVLCAGLSMAFSSGAGLWAGTTLLALACLAFVAGYEREATLARFGPPAAPPFFHLAEPSDAAPAAADRLAVYVIALLPWLLAFEAVNALGVPHDARNGWAAVDARVPVLPWTEPIYFFGYVLVLAAPLIVRTRREVRELVLQAWIATLTITLVYLAVPIVVIPRPVPSGGVFETWMQWERSFDQPMTSFPAFHAVWAVIAAAALARALPRFELLWWAVAVAISISCVTTGMHAIADVLAGLIAGIAVVRWRAIRGLVLGAAEWLANSWGEWDGGFIRAMTHGVWAAAGAFVGLAVAASLAGGMTAGVVAVALATILGAALWAQFIEGSPQLLRPYGYYGGILGAGAAMALTTDPWRMLAAYSVASMIVVAFGRCRCLVQGCCHGRPAPDGAGIRYRHPRSRVTRLSDLAGRPLHATQLYSIVWSAVVLVLLVRLWSLSAGLQFIAGAAFILTGLGRFVEEHFRGEPQTKIVAGMRVYQWLAIGSVLAGMAMMAAGNTPAPPPAAIGVRGWAVAALVGVVTYIAYGVDFPRLNTRFARLV